ncbi:MAG: hypothetical protein H6970_06455 [Gammaproteobacteria bacterium]|nr:hypothetical protein [Gammaproteobacteria bacterium]
MHEVYVEDGRPPWNRLDAIARYSFSLEHFEYSDDVLVMWEFDQLARLQQALGQPCDERMLETVLGAIWKGYLRSDPVVQQAVQPFLPQDDVFRIGVHVRATRESIQQKGVVALGDYFSPIDALIRQNENWELCLATDNQDVLKAFEDRYEPLVTWPKWFANVGDSLHLNPDCPNRLQAAQDALAEWLLLAASHYLITLNNSSFSQVARLMSGLPEQRQTRLASTPRGQSYRFRDSWKRLARWLRR